MNASSILIAGVIVGGCVLFVVKMCIWLGKAELAEKREKERLALHLDPIYRQKLAEDRAYELARQKQALELERFRLERHLALTRIQPEVYLINEEPTSIIPFPSLKRPQPEEKEKAVHVSQEPYEQPELETVIEEIRPNALEFVFGLDTQTGRLIKTTLREAVHIQLLGASGQGKSRQATSILTQLCSRNDEQHLQLALIDCEGETTAPFQSVPHARYVADEAKEAARTLRRLVVELERRDITRLASPVILIFVEEFLNLRRTMPVEYRDQALEDYTTLALRGRKRGMFLFSIGQTAYTEKAIRDAQMQFFSSMAFALKPTAARSAGFTNTELLNRLYAERKPGQFLLERPAGDSILLAPYVETSLVSSLLGRTVDAGSDFPPLPIRDAGTREDFPFPPASGRGNQEHRAHTEALVAMSNPLGKPSEDNGKSYRFTEDESPVVVQLYKALGSIDKVLRQMGKSARYHKDASRIIRGD